MNTFKNLGRNFSLIFSFTLLLGLLASCEQESKSEFLPIAITAPQAGEYTSSSLEITLVTTTRSSSIRYTLDGVTEPGKDQGTLYVAPIVINKSTTLKHIVIGRSGKTSRVVTSVYTLNSSSLSATNSLCIGDACTTSSTHNVTSAGMSISVDLRSNTTWTVQSSDTAMCPKPADGSNNQSVNITVTANTGAVARTCTVTFSATGVADVVVTINQVAPGGAIPANTLCIGAGVPCTKTFTSNLASAAGSVSVDLRSNTTWTVASSNTAMCPKPADGSNNQSVNITVTANTGAVARTCTVTFSATGVADVVVTINQVAPGGAVPANSLCIGAGVPCTKTSTSNLASAVGSVSVDLRSNTTWTVTSSNLGMCPKPANGSNNQNVSVTVNANNAVNAAGRSCIVTFSATGVTDVVVTINQARSSLVFEAVVDNDISEVSSGARTIGVTISSNTDWSLNNATSGHCTISTTSGTGDGTFNINILNNTSSSDRLCAIGIPGGDFIRITQRRPLVITSTNFTHNNTLPNDFVANWNLPVTGVNRCTGNNTGNNDFPQLSWNKTLSTIQSFVLIVDDPDGTDSDGNAWVHLNLYNIPSTTTSIARLTANASHEVTFPNGQGGQNSFNGLGSGISGTGWGGPCPPNGTHNYNFKIYAMSVSTLGSALNKTTRATFEATYGSAGNNQILDSAVIIGSRVAAVAAP